MANHSRSNFSMWVRRWLLSCGVLLAWFFVARLIALFYYGPWREILSQHRGDLLHAFFLGARFDGVVLGYLMIVPLLAFSFWLFFPGEKMARALTYFARAYLTFMILTVVGLTIGDLGYYSYFQDHFNILFFGFFQDDTVAVLKILWKNYPATFIIAASAFAVWVMFRVARKAFDIQSWNLNENPKTIKTIAAYVVCIPLLGIVGRGSFTLFPLHEIDATISTDPFINYLSYSGIHALYRATKVKYGHSAKWNSNGLYYGYNSWQDAAKDHFELKDDQLPSDPLDLIKHTTKKNGWAAKTRPHVVVLMMESWGGYWFRFHSPEFNLKGELEKHFKEDPVLFNFLPSMTATIGSLSALMVNSPHRPEGNFLTESRYMQVPFRFAPSWVYKKAGYKTRFIYGGGIGWRSIDRFAKIQGFDSVEGDVNVERKLNRPIEKHDWGIYDEDLFEYIEMTLEEAKQPEFVFVMTTTNHPPYQVPEKYQALPLQPPADLQKEFISDKSIVNGRFRVFQYANHKLGEFLTRIKASPLGEKLVMAVTGDHGFLLVNFKESDLLQKWQVPLYLYFPKKSGLKVDNQTFASHADIFPTLFDATLSEATHYSFGTSLFDQTKSHQAYYWSRLAISKEGAILADKTPTFLHWEKPFEHLKAGAPTPELQLLHKKYVSLMGLMDYFYEFERNLPPSTHGGSVLQPPATTVSN